MQAWLSWSERGTVNQRGGNSCILLFLVWFFLRPISPKEDTTHHLKPIVEAREYVYFLYIFIHTLTSRSQLPPFLSWFDYLNIGTYSDLGLSSVLVINKHLSHHVGILSPLLGRPDTIPSGKDTGKPTRSSDLCRRVSTEGFFGKQGVAEADSTPDTRTRR